MNPWKPNILELLRSVLKFSIWICICLIGLMTAIFSIVFTFEFLQHLWSWCDRVLFPGKW